MNASYAKAVDSALRKHGLQPVATPGGNFDLVYVRQSLTSSLAFLVKDLGQREVRLDVPEQLVAAGRRWCRKHLRASWFWRESGANFVLLHSGQLDPVAFQGMTDATGLHRTVVQSFTAIDVETGYVAQEKTWIVLGRAAKALAALARIP